MPRATADVFYAIADPTRREMLERLAERDRTVSELAEPHDMSQPAISQHLRVLRDAALVTVEQRGRQRYYQLHPDALKPVVNWLGFYERFWTSRLQRLKRHLEKRS